MEIEDLFDVVDAVAEIRWKAFALDAAIKGAGGNPDEEKNAIEWLSMEVADALRQLSKALEKKLESERVAAE